MLYTEVMFFLIYSFLGWSAEVIFFTVTRGRFVNRGFLNGPVCPIYGFGVILVVFCLTPLKDNLLLLFFGSVFLTSALEFLTGLVLELLFHEKWWDYSKEPFNIKGYICVRMSLLWGFACLLIVHVFHPLVEKFVNWIPLPVGYTAVGVLGAAFLADCIYTFIQVCHVRHNLRLLRQISAQLRQLSDKVGEELSDWTMNAMEKSAALAKGTEKRKENFQIGQLERELRYRTEIAELKEKYAHLNAEKDKRTVRLHRAFPQLKLERQYTGRVSELMEKIQESLQRLKAKTGKKDNEK